MARSVRILMILILAVFAAGSVVQATNAASMDMKMALAAIDGGMSDCQDCPDGSEDMQACDKICVSPVLAVVPSNEPGVSMASSIAESLVPRSVTGRTGLLDPDPPRPFILS